MGLVARTGSRARPEVRRAFLRFLLLNLLAVMIVGTGAIVWSIHVARTQAIRQATEASRSLAHGVVAPLCTPQLRQGDPAAIDALNKVIRDRMSDGSVLRVKIWSEDGRVIYSDAPSLIGQTFQIAAEDSALFGTDNATADISTLNRPENQLEAAASARMVESYVGIRDTQGQPLLFEAYFPGDRVDANARAIAWDLTPVALATIVALQLLQLPLALALARRLDHAHGDHARLLEHAVAASDLERRRIARDLHDGVIQDLAGVGYMLSSLEPQLAAQPGATDRRVGEALTRAAMVVQNDVRALRQTMVDLYPPDLTQAGLASALNDLVRPLREAGVRCEVRVADTAPLAELSIQVLYRAARELLRNVARHAHATEVGVTLEVQGHRGVLTVSDDGVGFDPANAPAGHLGLRLMAEAVGDAGGELVTTTAAGAGTTVRVSTGSH
jgi:two-component system, NarL family, sensor kinase